MSTTPIHTMGLEPSTPERPGSEEAVAPDTPPAPSDIPLAPSSPGPEVTRTKSRNLGSAETAAFSSKENRGSPPTQLAVIVRTFDGRIEPLCMAKPDHWHDFLWVISDVLDIEDFKLKTFRFFQQTGKSRDNDREPIWGILAWREVAPDSTIIVEPPPDNCFTVEDLSHHVRLRDTLPRNTTIKLDNSLMGGRCQPFEVNLDWTVRGLMIEIESNMLIPLRRQRLVHDKKELRFDETLRYHNVVEGSTIDLDLSR